MPSTTSSISTKAHKPTSSSSSLFALESGETFIDSYTEGRLSTLQTPGKTDIQTAAPPQMPSEHCFLIRYLNMCGNLCGNLCGLQRVIRPLTQLVPLMHSQVFRQTLVLLSLFCISLLVGLSFPPYPQVMSQV